MGLFINITILTRIQYYLKLLNRFKFTLKDNYKFNYIVIIDVIYLDSKPVL